MDPILTELDTPALTRAIKANFNSFFRSLAGSPVTDTWQGPDLFRWRTEIAHSWFNGLLSSAPPDERAGQQAQEALAYFQDHGVQSFSWWLDPGVDLQAWAAVLEPAGFRLDERTPGMAVVLADLPPAVPHPASLVVHPIDDLDDLPLWSDIFARGYELPPEMGPQFYDLFSGLGLELPLRSYLGYLDGSPVVTTTLYLGAGVAGIYNVATLPEARRQGLGSALTLHALQEAQQLGYQAGILQSSEMGYGVYERLGFRKLCNMEYFYWPT